MIRWAGDDPSREGLLDTPKRVAKAYREFFCRLRHLPGRHSGKTFSDVAGYRDMATWFPFMALPYRLCPVTACSASPRWHGWWIFIRSAADAENDDI
ncbi:GTP cyclohydrolase I [Rhizobium leguminosarum]|uniref:GTP cyclohydrolase I n=1 Tax=Rhizobium leguminosarum TaxID=384 RepID=UPI001FEFEEDE|nr:GTP cyclohydrolase I [Rhizobium leguminosarum]